LVKTFQNPQLFPELTVTQHMRIACHLHVKRALGIGRLRTLVSGMPADLERTLESKISQMLELCRLTSQRNDEAGALSYGGEKMLGVAMGMVCDPELLLLDEPASGLGHDEITNLDAVLRDLKSHGVTLCIIDHKVGFLGRLADRSIALHHGAVIASGKTEEVLANDAVVAAYLGKKHA
jgi:ABC-type branched-subunit amino acid transport system ATPase component